MVCSIVFCDVFPNAFIGNNSTKENHPPKPQGYIYFKNHSYLFSPYFLLYYLQVILYRCLCFLLESN